MATVDKFFTFVSDIEGFAEVGDSAVTLARDGTGAAGGTTANADNQGSLEFLGAATGTSERARQAAGNDWEDWGVPAGSVVTDVQVIAYKYRWWGHGGNANTRIRMRILDAAGTVLHAAGDLIDATTTDGTAAWTAGTTGTSRAVDSGKQASTTGVRFEVENTLQAATAGHDIGIDTIQLRITYTAGGGTPTGSATSTVGLTSSATGRRVGQRAATTTAGLTSSETGRRVGQRPAATTVALTSTASGRRVGQRAASTTAGLASTATGARKLGGNAASTLALASAASGRRVSRNAASTTAGVQSTTTARRKSQASHEEASAVPPFTTIVAGVLTTTGLASSGSGSASGVETHSGAAASTTGFTSAATGRRVGRRAAATSVGITSTVATRRRSRGTAASTVAFASIASRRRVSRGTCTSLVAFTGSAFGSAPGAITFVDYAGPLTLTLDQITRTLTLDGAVRALALDEREKSLALTDAPRTLEIDS